MLAELRELWRFRELLFSSTRRELQIRYKNSVLGVLWSLLNPLITVVVMTFALGFMGEQPPNFGAYVLAAYLPYMAFQLTLMDSAQSVLGSLSLVKKIYFPREILPLSVIFANFVHFLISLVVFFGFLLFIWVHSLLNPKVPAVSPFQMNTLYLPILLLIQFAMMTGLGLMISALNTFYEDVKYLLGVLLYLLFFLSPIMYFSERAEGKFAAYGDWAKYVYYANPVAALVTCYRKMLLAPQDEHAAALSWKLVGATGIASIVILILGYHVFNKLKWKFVERP